MSSITPQPPIPPSDPTSQTSSPPPPANLPTYLAGAELSWMLYYMQESGNIHTGSSSNVTYLEAGVFSKALLNFNTQYTAQYGSLPSPPPSNPNWAEQIEIAISSPLNSDPSQSLLSLAQAGNTDGIADAFDFGSNGSAWFQDAENLNSAFGNNTIPVPPGYGPNAQSLQSDVSFLRTDITQNPPNIADAATQIISIVNGLDSINPPLDPAAQILLWTLTTPLDHSGNTLLSAAQSGNTAELSGLLTGANANFLLTVINNFNQFE